MVFKLPLCFNSIFAAALLILYKMNVFVLAILVYLLYRFIAGFLIPVIRTTSQVRQQFDNMNKQHQEGPKPNAQGPTPNPQQTNQTSGTSKVGEYIDFEEVKWIQAKGLNSLYFFSMEDWKSGSASTNRQPSSVI